jgi:hypothetical protein
LDGRHGGTRDGRTEVGDQRTELGGEGGRNVLECHSGERDGLIRLRENQEACSVVDPAKSATDPAVIIAFVTMMEGDSR